MNQPTGLFFIIIAYNYLTLYGIILCSTYFSIFSLSRAISKEVKYAAEWWKYSGPYDVSISGPCKESQKLYSSRHTVCKEVVYCWININLRHFSTYTFFIFIVLMLKSNTSIWVCFIYAYLHFRIPRFPIVWQALKLFSRFLSLLFIIINLGTSLKSAGRSFKCNHLIRNKK